MNENRIDLYIKKIKSMEISIYAIKNIIYTEKMELQKIIKIKYKKNANTSKKFKFVSFIVKNIDLRHVVELFA